MKRTGAIQKIQEEHGSNSGIPTGSTAVAGVVHGLGNLIQFAFSAINRAARSRRVASDLSALAGARTALEQSGEPVRQTIGPTIGIFVDEDVCLNTCLSELESLVEGTWDRRFYLALNCDPNLPRVRCDILEFKNAVLNLLSNARDSMPDGGAISLRADLTTIPHGSPLIELCVSDSGFGMDVETVRRAFDPCFTTKTRGLGGAGLYMVEQFVRNAGGDVRIQSEVNVGTKVTLYLPPCL